MIKSFQRRCEIKGLPTGLMFSWGPTGPAADTNDLGRESIQRLMFVCFIPKCDLRFPGLPGDRLYCGPPRAPVCPGRGALSGNNNHGQEGTTLSCCHQHLFLPNPKATDPILLLEGRDHSSFSFFLSSSNSQGEVHKVQDPSPELRQKGDQKTCHCPQAP